MAEISLAIGETAGGKPFVLPAEAITQTFAILAKRRVGKTYTASVIAEEMVKNNLPFVVLDPTGAWWGLRASADGKSEGLPVVIIGGSHGDLPLEPTAGKVIADLVVDHPGFYVIDLSQTESDAQQDRFATDFAARLYRAKEKRRDPLHVFIDEADSFVPQRPFKGQERMLGAFEALVRRGGIRGIGVTLISQRSAVVNKNVLYMTEVLIALQTTGPADQATIEDWVSRHVSKEQRLEMMSSLASLQQGEAWFSSPGWLEGFERIKVRKRETFNSSATPKVGERRIEPQRLALVDLARLKDRIAETIEKAKADDPGELRKQIAALQKDLREKKAEIQDETRIERVEVPIPVLTDGQVKQLQQAISSLAEVGAGLSLIAEELGTALARATAQPATPPAALPPAARSAPPPRPAPAPRLSAGNDEVHLKTGERKLLEGLARIYPGKVTRPQLATLAGFSVRGGTFGTYFSTLKRAGFLIEEGGELQVTEPGLAYLGYETPPAPQTTEEVLAIWYSVLKLGERNMLESLVSLYPNWLSRGELAERAGITASGGTFGTYLSMLRRNGLAEVVGDQVRASETLFLA